MQAIKTGNENTLENTQSYKTVRIHKIVRKHNYIAGQYIYRSVIKHFITKLLETEKVLLTQVQNVSLQYYCWKTTSYLQISAWDWPQNLEQAYGCYQSAHTTQQFFSLWLVSLVSVCLTSLTQYWTNFLRFTCFYGDKNFSYSISTTLLLYSLLFLNT